MIPLFKVHTPAGVGAVVEAVFASGMIAEGEKVVEFEKAFSDKFGAEHVVIVNSGTSALALAARLLGIAPGDEVVTSPMSCFATFAPFFNAGAKLVWTDVDPTTGNIDAADVARKITSKTKAILAVHWAGQPFDYDAVKAAAGNIPVVCDAAHALGAWYKNRPIAAVGDTVIHSFQAIKHLTTIDGGCLIVRDAETAARARLLRWFGLDRSFKGGSKWEQDIPEAGYKYHCSNVAAAIGLAQMPYIDGILARHRANSARYDREITTPRVEKLRRSTDSVSSCWIYSLLVDDPAAFKAYATERGVAVDVVHVRNDRYSVFRDFADPNLPGLTSFASRLMNIPVGWWLSDDDVTHIVEVVNRWKP